MTVLEQVYASAGNDVIIETLELTCAAWSSSLALCNGFEDHECITEDGRTVMFLAAAIEVALPKRTNQGDQSLTFGLDNITGEAQGLIDASLDGDALIYITYRAYLNSDKSAPADAPYRMIVRGGTIQGSQVQVNAGFYDLINTAWPRNFYTSEFSPGLKYL